MSHAYNVDKKARRRELDALNPKRRRIRNQIKAGKLPRWQIVTQVIVTPVEGIRMIGNRLVKTVVGQKRRTEYRLKSVFHTLTGLDQPKSEG